MMRCGGEWRAGKARPVPGNAPPGRIPGGPEGNGAASFPAAPLPQAPGMRFEEACGIYRSDVVKTTLKRCRRDASRWSAPAGVGRAGTDYRNLYPTPFTCWLFQNARALGMRIFRHDGISRSDVSSLLINPVQMPPPVGRPRYRAIGRAGRSHTPCPSSAMSSGRLFLDRVARQHCPSPLHRHTQISTHPAAPQGKGDISTLLGRGHFYFALTVAHRSHSSVRAFCYNLRP
jgi:hypothetical protein